MCDPGAGLRRPSEAKEQAAFKKPMTFPHRKYFWIFFWGGEGGSAGPNPPLLYPTSQPGKPSPLLPARVAATRPRRAAELGASGAGTFSPPRPSAIFPVLLSPFSFLRAPPPPSHIPSSYSPPPRGMAGRPAAAPAAGAPGRGKRGRAAAAGAAPVAMAAA